MHCIDYHGTLTAITCSALPAVSNGMIVYSSNTTAPYVLGTTANYQCNEGFGLDGGDGIRTCNGDDNNSNGTWSGQPSNCSGIYNTFTKHNTSLSTE